MESGRCGSHALQCAPLSIEQLDCAAIASQSRCISPDTGEDNATWMHAKYHSDLNGIAFLTTLNWVYSFCGFSHWQWEKANVIVDINQHAINACFPTGSALNRMMLTSSFIMQQFLFCISEFYFVSHSFIYHSDNLLANAPCTTIDKCSCVCFSPICNVIIMMFMLSQILYKSPYTKYALLSMFAWQLFFVWLPSGTDLLVSEPQSRPCIHSTESTQGAYIPLVPRL